MKTVFFNTLTRTKEEFHPLTEGQVEMYTCGPTVYDYAHIGNFRTYIFEDVLRRYLKYRGYKVKQVMNITDIDDKTIRGAIREKVSLSKFTQKYIDAFFEDIEALNIEKAEFYPRATEHIPEMVDLIKKLLAKKFAYRAKDGSIYYDISKFKNYGQLSHFKIKRLKAGARVKHDEYKKEELADFALWKAVKTPEKIDFKNIKEIKFIEKIGEEPYWLTEIGAGRPGWHIECSAMSMKYLGESFDIHTGGVDNIFPHHENEIAQSEAATGKKFVKFWLHSEHLLVNNRKMSKSRGNFYTLRDLINKGYNPLAFRLLCLQTHYQSKLNFTFKSLEAAENSLKNLYEDLQNIYFYNKPSLSESFRIRGIVKHYKQSFEQAMDNNLDTAVALACLFELVKETNKILIQNPISTKSVYETILDFDKIFGLRLKEKTETQLELSSEVKELLKQREEARDKKDWQKADEIRKKIYDLGYEVEDTKIGQRVKKR